MEHDAASSKQQPAVQDDTLKRFEQLALAQPNTVRMRLDRLDRLPAARPDAALKPPEVLDAEEVLLVRLDARRQELLKNAANAFHVTVSKIKEACDALDAVVKDPREDDMPQAHVQEEAKLAKRIELLQQEITRNRAAAAGMTEEEQELAELEAEMAPSPEERELAELEAARRPSDPLDTVDKRVKKAEELRSSLLRATDASLVSSMRREQEASLKSLRLFQKWVAAKYGEGGASANPFSRMLGGSTRSTRFAPENGAAQRLYHMLFDLAEDLRVHVLRLSAVQVAASEEDVAAVRDQTVAQIEAEAAALEAAGDASGVSSKLARVAQVESACARISERLRQERESAASSILNCPICGSVGSTMGGCPYLKQCTSDLLYCFNCPPAQSSSPSASAFREVRWHYHPDSEGGHGWERTVWRAGEAHPTPW